MIRHECSEQFRTGQTLPDPFGSEYVTIDVFKKDRYSIIRFLSYFRLDIIRVAQKWLFGGCSLLDA